MAPTVAYTTDLWCQIVDLIFMFYFTTLSVSKLGMGKFYNRRARLEFAYAVPDQKDVNALFLSNI
jgi:hypothetical protein